MKNIAVPFFLTVILVAVLLSSPAHAQFRQSSWNLFSQQANAGLSGKITGPSGTALPGAKVSLKNLSTGETVETQTDASGAYQLPNLVPGEYEISVVAEGFQPNSAKITVTADAPQQKDLSLEQSQGQPATQGQPPSAPSPNKTEPSLNDLGFPSAATQSNAKQQALLDKRTHMLKIHQRLGLITTIPLAAAVISSAGAGGRSTSSTTRDLHAALGSTAAGMYLATAYFAIRAPRIAGTETRGPIRWHKALAWVHGPGMILTPILGAIAFQQKSRGEKVHGIASAHLPVALITAGAYGAAILAVSIKF